MADFKNRLNQLPYSPWTVSWFFGILSFIVRIPFLFRYDILFNGDTALCYLMSLRISHGDRPLYLYGQDYQGAAEYYLAGILNFLFGPSIPLYSSVGLLEWSLATVICVYLLIQGTSMFHGIIGGIIISIGVPFSLYQLNILAYPFALLWAMLILLQVYFILKNGFTFQRFFILGLTTGSGLYLAKQFLPAGPACFLALILFNSWDFKKFPYIRILAGFSTGCFLAYLPEIIYRWHHPVYRSFVGIASPMTMIYNLHCILKSIPVYFDAQFFSRTPAIGQFTSTYFLYPRSPMDVFFSILGGWVVIFIIKTLFTSALQKNIPLFLLSGLVVMNILAILFSEVSNGNFWETRRYLIVSSIVFSAFLGIFFADLMSKKKGLLPVFSFLLMLLFLGRVLLHETDLLAMPEQNMIFQMKEAIHIMDHLGINRGLAPWGEAYMVDAITNERIILASDNNLIPEYQKIVSLSNKIVWIDGDHSIVKQEIKFGGNVYRKAGAKRYISGYVCVPYQKVD